MINIALDGPSGSGKSTVAKIIAKKLNILYLDTGAMYRACALHAINNNIVNFKEENVKDIINNIDLVIKYEDGVQKTILNGEDVSDKIRLNEVSMMASNISALKCVRDKMVEMQRKVASKIDSVLDGRDIGTVVLPNAKYKFYITAKPEVRAKRRFAELVEKGQKVVFEDVLKDILTRDFNDSHRENSPLRQADDAILIDTSNLNVDEVVEKIISEVK